MAVLCCFGLSHCALLPQPTTAAKTSSVISVQLKKQPDSQFKQVVASFSANSSRNTAFKVISNLSLTQQWLPEVNSIKTLTVYNYNNFLLHTILDSPWPFKQRETVTCVTTSFFPSVSQIHIKSCSDRYPQSKDYVRVQELSSQWFIKQITANRVEIHYQTWLNPQGNVPAFFFNKALAKQTKQSLSRLKVLIEQSSD